MKSLDVFNIFTPLDISIHIPFIIAEAGVNHEGSMDIAKRLIEKAHEGGADAIKFQSYKAETIAAKDSPYYWDIRQEPTRSQYELFKKYDKFWKKEYEELKKYCDHVGIEFMSTPFDLESARFLNDLVNVHKISSSDITNLPFIESICSYQKPIILSTGGSYLYEIIEAESWIAKHGNPLALLHCILNYPTTDQNANLGMIAGLKKHFPQHIIGYSDHTLPGDMKILEVAMLMGARIIEKHFTHNKSLPGNDHYHAMDKEDLKRFRRSLPRLKQILGSFEVIALLDEEPARRNARRSLVAAKFIPQGKSVEWGDLTWKRPAHGISPRSIQSVIGGKALRDIEADTVFQWTMIG